MRSTGLLTSANLTRKQLEDIAKGLVRKHSLCQGEVYKSGAEATLGEILLRKNIKALHEAEFFKGTGGKLDYITNLFKGRKIVGMEIHAFGYSIEKGENDKVKKYIDGLISAKKKHPEIYLIFIADIKRERLGEKFGVSTAEFCEEYWYVPYASHKYEELSKLVEKLESSGEREDKQKEWRKGIVKIIAQERRSA